MVDSLQEHEQDNDPTGVKRCFYRKESPSKTSAKRHRRSRWESDTEAVIAPSPTSQELSSSPENVRSLGSSGKKVLNDIVKKLSSVIQEKTWSSPSKRSITQTALDPEIAKARALAQANLLSQSLPSTLFNPIEFAKRLYVGNLYYELKEDDIRNVFAPFGAIHSIDLSMEPGTGRSKGFCFLEFNDVLAAESAVQVLNGSTMANRAIKVGRPHRGNQNPKDSEAAVNIGKEAIRNVPTKCVYIGGVRTELNSRHIESIFAPFGEIKHCVMTAVSSSESGVHRGYGFIEFGDEICAMNAIQHMNGFELAGQTLKVGKASAVALLVNLKISNDKVVDGIHSLSDAKQRRKIIEPILELEEKEEQICLCLLNLIKPGDVDENLRGEVASECSKYGDIAQVVIHELSSHVRIFVQYEDEAGALRAKGALHGRYFGGNAVKAHFYPIQMFLEKKYDEIV
uniref:Poly(U)bindingsplicing factor PUF60 putative n=1 Tax=Albugo laibachii Nc14 TaxID=890382 RepID=F0WWX1_9STRA|nr:Poly(U)bindingsplicing factor PUF60 putative [Albugo laibachii Nc14]|eukprot:CCA25956.1 Poly(U)bindingsplicing factor PUF60 putative [Albugo laibachii Nc14]